MPNRLKHFLLVYDVKGRHLRDCREFSDSDEATAAYAELEREHIRQADWIQIVLVGSDSIETVKATHGNLFGSVSVDDFLAGVLTER